jgi:hypothetical protein
MGMREESRLYVLFDVLKVGPRKVIWHIQFARLKTLH